MVRRQTSDCHMGVMGFCVRMEIETADGQTADVGLSHRYDWLLWLIEVEILAGKRSASSAVYRFMESAAGAIRKSCA